MQGRATILGHPIHPILVSFPIAFFTGAFVCDIIYVLRPTPFWPVMSLVLIGFGIIGGALAAAFGLIDFFTVPMSRAAKKTALIHLVLAATTIVFFCVAFFLRDYDPTSTAGYILTALGVLVLGGAGAFGGHLAFHHRIGVEENADMRSAAQPAPRPTTESSSAWSSGKR
jgi:uncharacterized membrane protein